MISKTLRTAAAALALAFGTAIGTGAAAPVAPTPTEQLTWTLHLLEQARYGEATNAAVQMVATEPNAAVSLETRGTLALSIGSRTQAQADLEAAARRAPQDAVAQYGLALCALFDGRFEAAQAQIMRARATPGLTDAQSADLVTLADYIDFLQNKPVVIPADWATADDPMRQELAAMAALRGSVPAGTAALTQFLATPSGVPLVRDAEGIRALFNPDQPLQPSVIEPSTQHTDAARLADGIMMAAQQIGLLKQVSGTMVIDAHIPASSPVNVVSFAIDGQTVAMLNSAPFQYDWDTTRVINGRHSVTIGTENASGQMLSTHTRLMQVENASPQVVDTGLGDLASADVASAEQRLWLLLRLHPAHVAAEWDLADALASTGNTTDADTHRLVAAALDPNYKDSRHYARLVLGQAKPIVTASAHAFKIASTSLQGLWHGDVKLRQIALTFDDGPNLEKTPALLDALQKADAPATFFVVGERAAENPDIIRRMAAMGDDVENHSYTHPNMDQVEPIVAEEEMLRNCVVVRSLTGRAPHYFRPPGGNGGAKVQEIAQEYGLTETFWSLDAINAEFAGSPAALVKAVVDHVHPGSIVLMHDAPDATIAAIPDIVAGLRAQGYTLVTLSHMDLSAPTAMPQGALGKE